MPLIGRRDVKFATNNFLNFGSGDLSDDILKVTPDKPDELLVLGPS